MEEVQLLWGKDIRDEKTTFFICILILSVFDIYIFEHHRQMLHKEPR